MILWLKSDKIVKRPVLYDGRYDCTSSRLPVTDVNKLVAIALCQDDFDNISGTDKAHVITFCSDKWKHAEGLKLVVDSPSHGMFNYYLTDMGYVCLRRWRCMNK